MTPELPIVAIPATLAAQSSININNNCQAIVNYNDNNAVDVMWQDALQASMAEPVVANPVTDMPAAGTVLPELPGQCLAATGKALPESVLPDTGIKDVINTDEEPDLTEEGQVMTGLIQPATVPPGSTPYSIAALREKVKELPEAFTSMLSSNIRTPPAANESSAAIQVPVAANPVVEPAPVTSIPIIPLPVAGTKNGTQVQTLPGPGQVSATNRDNGIDQSVSALPEINTVEEAPIRIPELRPVRTENIATVTPDTATTVNPRWQHVLGERVIWQVRNEITTAQIRLDPPELGPLQVNVRLHNEHASVQFITQSADVKDAISSSLSMLRDQFVQAGIRMADVSVDWQAGQRGDQQSFQTRGGDGGIRGEEPSLHEEIPGVRLSSHTGLIDCYV